MNSKLFLMTAAVVAAFTIVAAASIVGSLTIATPALAQTMGRNMTGEGTMGRNMTGGNMTGGNWTLIP